jgi:predicted RNA-binding protein with PIN domain
MPYIIDGHNLIPKFGISLTAEDDEAQLVRIVQEFARITRKGIIEIYFDKAAQSPFPFAIPSFLKVTFTKNGQSADNAIIKRVQQLKNDAKNWQIVSSDHYVQREVKRFGANFLSAEEFARLVYDEINKAGAKPERVDKLSSDEVDEWMDLFLGKKKNDQ